jgi:ATP-dependent DNA ligase
VVLDGEIVALDAESRPSLTRVQRWVHIRESSLEMARPGIAATILAS